MDSKDNDLIPPQFERLDAVPKDIEENYQWDSDALTRAHKEWETIQRNYEKTRSAYGFNHPAMSRKDNNERGSNDELTPLQGGMRNTKLYSDLDTDTVSRSKYKACLTTIGSIAAISFILVLFGVLQHLQSEKYAQRQVRHWQPPTVQKGLSSIFEDSTLKPWLLDVKYRSKYPIIWNPTKELNLVYYASGGKIYSADIRRKTSQVKIIAGGGLTKIEDSGSDALASAIALQNPYALVVDRNSNLYFMDKGKEEADLVLKLNTTSSMVSIVFIQSALDDISLYIQKIVVNPYSNDVYLLYRSSIKKIVNSPLELSIVTGADEKVGSTGDNGPAKSALFGNIADVCFDRAGHMYISDSLYNNIRVVSPDGLVRKLAGFSTLPVPSNDVAVRFSGDGGLCSRAEFNRPTSMVVGTDGNLYLADSKNYRVRKITPKGQISTIAGTGILQVAGKNITGRVIGVKTNLCAIQDSSLSTFPHGNGTCVLLRMFCYRSPDSLVYVVLGLSQESHCLPASYPLPIS
jgi:hypothetical protein